MQLVADRVRIIAPNNWIADQTSNREQGRHNDESTFTIYFRSFFSSSSS
uniref:Uncharacterized protein n=1 Tax=Onchocerca volvulus TaxID=6282 RepID=A0A8R1XY52_ONCVO